jgi:hypothetical protein
MSQIRKWGFRRSELVAACVGVGLGLGLLFHSASLRGQQAKTADPGAAAGAGSGAASDVFTKEELARIKKQVVVHPSVIARHMGHGLQVLRVTKGSGGDDKAGTAKPARRLADVILYDHNSGRAERVLFDVTRNDVVKSEPMTGVPSPGEEELQEAVRIVEADPAHAKLLKAGGQLTGGFLASAPPGAPPHDRYVMMQVLTPDRRDIERVVIVDLSSGTIATSR